MADEEAPEEPEEESEESSPEEPSPEELMEETMGEGEGVEEPTASPEEESGEESPSDAESSDVTPSQESQAETPDESSGETGESESPEATDQPEESAGEQPEVPSTESEVDASEESPDETSESGAGEASEQDAEPDEFPAEQNASEEGEPVEDRGEQPEQDTGDQPEEGGQTSDAEGDEEEQSTEEKVPGESESPEEVDEEQGADREEEPASEAEEEEGSIKDMLEEESERAQEEESEPSDEEEEEELPEGYITVEQLPEEEEYETPGWIKNTGYAIVSLVFLYFCWSYLFLPLWENYHSMRMHTSVENNRYEAAEDYLERGLIMGGALVHYPDRFKADFLGQLLTHRRYQQFKEVFDQVTGAEKPGPWVTHAYVQYLLQQGRWKKALAPAERLQLNPETRGFGYLFHGKASLRLGNVPQAESDLTSARRWLADNPAVKRLRRDVYIAQGEYERAQQVANQLRNQITASKDASLRVRDYLQLARINARLNRHRVAEDMLNQALEVNPNYKLALKELTFRYLLQDRWELAEPLIRGDRTRRPYRKMYPMDSFGWWSLAELNLARDKPGKAIPHLERARSLNPRNPEVQRVLGKLHLAHLDAPTEATQYFRRARELGLDRLQFIQNFARANYQSGRYEAAVAQFKLLRKHLDKATQKLKYNLGSAYLGAGQYKRANRLLKQAFKAGYRTENIFIQRGLLRELQGNAQDAQVWFIRGKEWATQNNERVTRIQKNLTRSLQDRPPRPKRDWLAPLDKTVEIPYWRQLSPEQPLGNL